MFYEIQNFKDDRLYLASGGHYVSQSGVIGDGTVEPTWVLGAGNGIETSSLDHAQLLADRYGGRPVPSQGQGGERSRSRINRLRDQLNDDDRFYSAIDVLISVVGLPHSIDDINQFATELSKASGMDGMTIYRAWLYDRADRAAGLPYGPL
jgi:hypothetical protein